MRGAPGRSCCAAAGAAARAAARSRLSGPATMADALARQREQFMREQFAALAAKKELDEARRRDKAAKREAEERARLKAQAAPAMVRPLLHEHTHARHCMMPLAPVLCCVPALLRRSARCGNNPRH